MSLSNRYSNLDLPSNLISKLESLKRMVPTRADSISFSVGRLGLYQKEKPELLLQLQLYQHQIGDDLLYQIVLLANNQYLYLVLHIVYLFSTNVLIFYRSLKTETMLLVRFDILRRRKTKKKTKIILYHDIIGLFKKTTNKNPVSTA